MKKDMNQMLVEITVRRTLEQIKASPERAVRNLIDLGLEFSDGRFQKQLLETLQEMLRSRNSAYYTLVRNVIDSVTQERLTVFGVNLGYKGCTEGARIIRETEAERGFNIPWSLFLEINGEKLAAQPDFYPGLLRQGLSLGINVYLLSTPEDPAKLVPLIQARPECAFVIFLRGRRITASFLEKMQDVQNVMFSVYDDADMPAACRQLRDAKQLYAVHLPYTLQNKERILNGQWLGSLIPVKPAFVILRTDEHDAHQLNQDIYDYVVSVRGSQRYPFVLLDMKYDILAIDRIISNGECAAGFDMHGSLRTHEGLIKGAQYNIFNNSLETVLSRLEDSRSQRPAE